MGKTQVHHPLKKSKSIHQTIKIKSTQNFLIIALAHHIVAKKLNPQLLKLKIMKFRTLIQILNTAIRPSKKKAYGSIQTNM